MTPRWMGLDCHAMGCCGMIMLECCAMGCCGMIGPGCYACGMIRPGCCYGVLSDDKAWGLFLWDDKAMLVG